jgi:type I restriction enzyme S subunit
VSFPRYPKYKPSGVEWLGEVPEHWEILRIARLFREVVEPGADDLPMLSVSIHDGVSDEEMGEQELERKVTRSDDRSKYKRVAPGDLVYNMMRAWQGAFGTVAVDGMVSPAYVVARPRRRIETICLEYQLRTPQAIEQMRRQSRGITDFRLRLYWDEFKDMQVVLPPQEEQVSVAAFLGHEIAKIDALVSEQERLIELLKEKRQAVISHAVTKGLNPNASMKPSGIEWLGDIPSHWAVTPLMRLTPDDRQIMYGIVLPGPDVVDGVPIVKGGDVAPGRLSLERLKRTTAEIEAAYVRSRLCGGDIVYSIRGSIGSVELVPDEIAGANITQDAARVSPLPELDKHWLLFALRSHGVFGQLDQTSNGATIRGINIFDLKRARIPLPPPDEQAQIASHVLSETAMIDVLSVEAERSIELLRERRTALISAAVTGQIDVRDLVTAETAS